LNGNSLNIVKAWYAIYYYQRYWYS
jgi:hypothetical protein